MPDKTLELINIKGPDVVFTIKNHGGVYRTDLAQVSARGDYTLVSYYDDRGWRSCELPRLQYGAVLDAVEAYASLAAPADLQWWKEQLAPAIAPVGTEAERLTHLVAKAMGKFGVTQKAVAQRLGITRQTLSDYCEGRGKGALGITLELALTGLLGLSSFDVSQGGQQ